MWENCIVSLGRLKEKDHGSGCILAHSMGLGKTLTTVAFVHTMLTNEVCTLRLICISGYCFVLAGGARRSSHGVGDGAGERGV